MSAEPIPSLPRDVSRPKQTLTVREIAEWASVDDATVRVWINTGKLPAYKLPGSGSQSIIRVRRDEFDKFLRVYLSTRI